MLRCNCLVPGGKNESISGLIFLEFDTPPTLTWQVCVLRCGRLRWRERKKSVGESGGEKKGDEIRCDRNNFGSAK